MKSFTSMKDKAKDLENYFESEYFGDNEMRDTLNNLDDDTFFNLEENISDLNGIWLKTHKNYRYKN